MEHIDYLRIHFNCAIVYSMQCFVRCVSTSEPSISGPRKTPDILWVIFFHCTVQYWLLDIFWYTGIFIKKAVLSITSSGEIGFWEHDTEASKMQGRARGRNGERKTHHITISPWNLEDIYWMWQKTPRAQERTRAKRKGSYPTKKRKEFSTTPIYSKSTPDNISYVHWFTILVCEPPQTSWFIQSMDMFYRHFRFPYISKTGKPSCAVLLSKDCFHLSLRLGHHEAKPRGLAWVPCRGLTTGDWRKGNTMGSWS